MATVSVAIGPRMLQRVLKMQIAPEFPASVGPNRSRCILAPRWRFGNLVGPNACHLVFTHSVGFLVWVSLL